VKTTKLLETSARKKRVSMVFNMHHRQRYGLQELTIIYKENISLMKGNKNKKVNMNKQGFCFNPMRKLNH
jgi:hypothetical protein